MHRLTIEICEPWYSKALSENESNIRKIIETCGIMSCGWIDEGFNHRSCLRFDLYELEKYFGISDSNRKEWNTFKKKIKKRYVVIDVVTFFRESIPRLTRDDLDVEVIFINELIK